VRLDEVIEGARQLKESLETIRRTVNGAVMFVDLAGSTEFKAKHPNEELWLPRLAIFLQAMTRLVEVHGRVVKYIGDEVMVFFEGDHAVVNAEHTAEQILEFCSRFRQYEFQVKMGLDYGAVSMLDFLPKGSDGGTLGKADPHGIVVDRCARIMGRTKKNVVLCSAAFRQASQAKQRWRAAGSFKAKGIANIVRVYQLQYRNHEQIAVVDQPMTIDECVRQVATLKQQLREARAMRPVSSGRRR
jgi:class 3 adenylate cyclase